MSGRIQKVNSLLKQEISKMLLRDFHFADTLVTLTRVETTANLIEAFVYVSVMPEQKAPYVIETLNSNVYGLQQQLNKRLNMRPIPRMKFMEDKNIAEAAKVEGLLEKLKKEEK